MLSTTDFVQIVTSGYAFSKKMPKIVGPIGPAPDASYCSNQRSTKFAGKSIPSFAQELKFIFSHEERTDKRDIYDYFDFWLVSENQKQKLDFAASSSFEFLKANTFDIDGTKTFRDYWIAKVTRQIDCIDAQKSIVTTQNLQEGICFADTLLDIELDDTLAPRFSNYGASTYRTYQPDEYVKTLELLVEKIPEDCNIFTPMFWPGHVLCTYEFFSKKIIDSPYSTWSLRLPNTGEQSSENWRAYR